MPIGGPSAWRAGLSAVLLPLLLAACDSPADSGPEAGLALAPGPHLFIDNFLIEESSGVRRVVHSPSRDPRIPNPLVTGVEDRVFQPYFSILRDNGLFRLWYNTPIDANAEADASHLAYLESTDGITWRRPHRILEDPSEGIRFGASVVARPEGGYALGFNKSGGLKIATSPGGLNWTLVHHKELIQHTHDISGLTYDPIRGRYIAILSSVRSQPSGGRAQSSYRMTRQSVSQNLLDWEPAWDILDRDYRDHEATEFYAMDAFLARGDLLIAMVKVLREDLDADGRAPGGGDPRGIGYTALAWSRDGRTWTRDRETYFAPTTVPGAWDHAMAWIDEQVLVGDSLYLYYAGYATGHKGDKARERQIGLVVVPRDRYAGWEPSDSSGTIRTRLLRHAGSRITFNVDASDGSMGVKVVDSGGREVLGRCESIEGDHLSAPLRCESDVADLRGPFRLLLELSSARLYALTVQ